jgi:hypothetical protein
MENKLLYKGRKTFNYNLPKIKIKRFRQLINRNRENPADYKKS